MKKILMLMGMAALAFTASSCNDDNNHNLGAAVAGNYNVTIAGTGFANIDGVNFRFTRNNDKSADLRIGTMNVVLTGATDAVPVILNEFKVNLSGVENEVIVNCEGKIDATVNGVSMKDIVVVIANGKISNQKTVSLPINITIPTDPVMTIVGTATGEMVNVQPQ